MRRLNLAVLVKAQPTEEVQLIARDFLTEKVLGLTKNPKDVQWRWLPGPRRPLAPQYLEVSWR